MMVNFSLIDFIASKFGTPVYIYWEEIIKKQIKKVFDVFSGVDFYPTFAVKANSNPQLLRLIKESGFGMEVASLGELYGAIKAYEKPENVIWNSNGKTLEEMKIFLNNKIGKINIDSLEELTDWGKLLSGNSVSKLPKFYLRINPDIDGNTHKYISTGLRIHKFGILIGSISFGIEMSKKIGIEISGFHIHIGSQIVKMEPFIKAFEEVTRLLKKYGLSEVNIGGGWGINYDNDLLDLEAYRNKILPILKDYKIIAEFGRFIIGEAGIYLVRVIRIKKSGDQMFVVVDGGMNHLLRPALYGAKHPFRIIGESSSSKAKYNIVGPICESGDVLCNDVFDFVPKESSLIAFAASGAYGFSMANHYNGYPLPPEVLIRCDGNVKLIRKRENLKDLYRGAR